MHSTKPSTHFVRSRPTGFTLLEMVLVLAILAILAAVAVRSLSSAEDRTRFTATQQQLSQVQVAIDGDPSIRQPDGSRIPNGFVQDVGRLPMLVGTDGKTQLEELWVLPVGVLPYAIKSAPAPDSDILMGTGWHGPYLQMPIGQTTLFDGWANAFSMTTGKDGISLASIQSLGSDNAPGATADDVYSADLPPSPMMFSSSDYLASVTLIVTGSSTPASANLFEPDGTGNIKAIAGSGTTNADATEFSFAGVSPGSRVVRLYGSDSTPLATKYIVVPKGGLTNVVVNLATTQPSSQPSGN